MKPQIRHKLMLATLTAVLFSMAITAQADVRMPSDPMSFPDIVERVLPTIVTVYSEQTIRVQYRDPWFFGPDDEFFRRFFGYPNPSPQRNEPRYREYRKEGLGSGVIITETGYILTNNHVISEADEIRVRISGSDKDFIAKVVGKDDKSDLAVLKIEPDKPLTATSLGDSDEIRIGEWVLAIGHPFELDHTVTAGIISAKGRNRMGITDYEDFIQTDAAINPGNSGGALINLKGEVIGINTAIASRTGVYSGIGFAIPINMARSVMDQLIEHGYVSRGYIGVGIQDVTPDLAKAFGMENPSGVLITQVTPNMPGDKAGLRSGDIVLSLDNVPLNSGSELRNRVAAKAPGSKIALHVLRDGKFFDLEVILTELPGAQDRTEEPVAKRPATNLGMKLVRASEAETSEYGYPAGLRVESVEPDSPADKAGIMQGDFIFEVDRKPVVNVAEYDRIVSKWGGKSSLLILVGRGGSMLYLVVLPEN